MPKSVVDSVNEHLNQMRAAGRVMDVKAKGALGEAAVMDIMHDYRARRGGLLYNGFMYPYATDRSGKVYLGNIFWDPETQKFSDVTRQLNDEIDVLLITHYRIFPIEVKSYHMRELTLTDAWMIRDGAKVDKSPLAQAEKHARHLYHQLYDVIPDGDPHYIIPMVCFVDRVDKGCNDQRTPEAIHYMPVVPINGLRQAVADRDFPVSDCTLDLNAIEKKLKAIQRERTID